MSRSKSILITGSEGFFGSHIYDILSKANYKVIRCVHKHVNQQLPHLKHLVYVNLCRYVDTYNFISKIQPDAIIHAAALSDGIIWNQENVDNIFAENSTMSFNLLKAAKVSKVPKVVSILSSCAYPDQGEQLITEDSMWNGLPHDSIKYFGLYKRNILAYSQAISKTYGLKYVCAAVNNLYGPRDNTSLYKMKIVMAMIKKIIDANLTNRTEIYGHGSGNTKRQFTYVKDAAIGIQKVLESYEDITKPINISAKETYSIKELVDIINNIVCPQNPIKIQWDTSQPNGQLTKHMDTYRAKSLLDFTALTSLEDGLKETIKFYCNNQFLSYSQQMKLKKIEENIKNGTSH